MEEILQKQVKTGNRVRSSQLTRIIFDQAIIGMLKGLRLLT